MLIRYRQQAVKKSGNPLAKKYGISGDSRQSEKQNISTIFLTYGDGHLSVFKHLMDDFSSKAKKMGIKMQIADIQTQW